MSWNKHSWLIFLVVMGCAGLWSCKPGSTQTQPPSATNDTLANKIAAIKALDARIKADSLNAGLYFQRAQLYQGQNDLKSALSDMFIALSLDSTNADYFLYSGDLFIQDNEPQRAISLMQTAIRTDSANIKYYVYGGKFCYLMKDYKKAMTFYNAAIARDMFNPDVYFQKGMAFKEMGDTAKAISSFQTCAEQDPKNAEAFLQIGLLMQARGDKLANKYLDNAVKANPKGEDALYAKGFAQQEAKDYAGSIATFKQIIAANYRNEDALYALGYSYLMLDSFVEGYKYFGMAAKIDPTFAEAYYKKGVCAEQLKRVEEAKSLYQQALNLNSQYEPAKKALARLGG
ncbi:MAG: tetratricopeptide repeat protein [Chitinophagales bacterium]